MKKMIGVTKTNTLEAAEWSKAGSADHGHYKAIILGCDGLFWVVSQKQLLDAGYSKA